MSACIAVDDVSISARKGMLVVRSGKGDAYREVPLNASSRKAVDDWLKDRGKPTGDDQRGLFVGPRGLRITPRSVDRVVRGVADRAGLELSAHVYADPNVMPTSTSEVRGAHAIVMLRSA